MLRENLILDLRPVQGTLKDFSGQGNDASFIGTSSELLRGERGYGYKANGTDRLQVAADSAFDVDAGTWAFLLDIEKAFTTANQFLFYKRDIAGASTRYGFTITNNTTVTLVNAGAGGNSAFTIAESDYVGAATMIITKASGSSAPKIYFDGVHVTDGGTAVTLDTTSAELSIGGISTGSNYEDSLIHAVRVYSADSTPEQVAQMHKDLVSLKMKRHQKRHFYTPPSVPKLASGAGWNMLSANGIIFDQGPNENDGTINGSVTSGETPWGETALEFNGKDSFINCGTDSSLNYTTESFGGWAWVYIDTFTTSGALFAKGRVSSTGYQLIVNASAAIFQTQNPSGNQQAISGSLSTHTWYLIGFFSEAGGNNYLYIDNEQNGTTPARVDPGSSVDPFMIGRQAFTSSNYWDGKIAAPQIDSYSSRAEFEADMNTEFKRVSNKVLYHEDFRDAAVHAGSYSSGNPLGNTELTVSNQSVKIGDGEVLGEKACYGTTFGSQAAVEHDHWPYGTWIIRFNHTNNINSQFAFVAPDDVIAFGTTSYFDTHGSNNRIRGIGTPGIGFNSAVGSVSAGLHTLKIQKTKASSNNVTIYLDDMTTPLAADTGSNPYTDTTTSALKYIFANYGSPSTGYIDSVTHYYGIV